MALETVAHVMRNPRKKESVANKSEFMESFFDGLRPRIRAGATSEDRIKCLEVLSSVLSAESEAEYPVNEALLRRLDIGSNPKPLDQLVQASKQPFSDVAVAALEVIKVLSRQRWSIKLFKSQPGLIEFLMDRSGGQEKRALEVKYDIVRNVFEYQGNVFSEDIKDKMEKFIRDGPFYTAPVMEVALDEA